MKVLERIALVLSATEAERERIQAEMRKHLGRAQKRKSPLLVVSSFIEEVAAQEEERAAEMPAAEKASAVGFLNKRLSQINNTQEKVRLISQFTLDYMRSSVQGAHTKSFLLLVIKRMLEQIKVQVSANKASAQGYALFLLALSEHFPGIVAEYRRVVFKSVLPMEYVLGMYRVYFTLLRETRNTAEAWSFISELLNHHEDIDTTFNPCVVSVFVDVLRDAMRQRYREPWFRVETCILTQYLPELHKKFSKDAHCIQNALAPARAHV